MKRLLLIALAVLIASLTMAQFEKNYQRTAGFDAVYKAEMIMTTDFDSSFLLETRNENSTIFHTPIYTINFDNNPGVPSSDLPIYVFSHETGGKLGDLDWKVDSKADEPVNSSSDTMKDFIGGKNISEIPPSEGNFAYLNAVKFKLIPNSKWYVKSHMDLGPFNFSDIENPILYWNQIYRKFNSDITYISTSTDGGVTWERKRVNDISSGYAKTHDNLITLPKSTGTKPSVFIRFSFEETTSTDQGTGVGYGWQVDDIRICDNLNFDIEIGKIATGFGGFIRYPNSPQSFHPTSTYVKIPVEEFKNGFPLSFAAPFTNVGALAVTPMLSIKLFGPSGGDPLFDTTYVHPKQVQSGEVDTIIPPIVEGDFGYLFNGLAEKEDIEIGTYKILYSISIPEEDEPNLTNNSDSTFFELTANGEFSRDNGKTNIGLAPHIWSGGGQTGDQIGVQYLFYEPKNVYSVDLFITNETQTGNAIKIVQYVQNEEGYDLVDESLELEITSDMLGKWNTIKLNQEKELIPLDGSPTSVIVMAEMIYYHENKHVFIGSDETTKGSFWGIKWTLKSNTEMTIFGIPSCPPNGLGLRINTVAVKANVPDFIANDVNVNLYPNPCKDFITLEASEEIKSVEILSIMGNLVGSQNGNDKIFTCSTQNLPEGNYIFRIHTENSFVVKQFSVVK